MSTEVINKSTDEVSQESLNKEETRERYGYVYLTTNLINGKKYIGMRRSKVHDSDYFGSGKYLKPDLEKYGKKNFSNVILEWCYSEKELCEAEKRHIFESGALYSDEYYNVMEGGWGGNNKSYLSPEEYALHSKKISDSKKNRPRTENEKAQLDALHKSNIGKKRSEETRKRMSEAQLKWYERQRQELKAMESKLNHE